MNKKILVVIGGPTCVGKSEICLKLAKKFETEIISADSRQFYKELNIGVAKLKEEKLKEVKHHLINNRTIKQNYSIGEYQDDFEKISKKIFKTKDILFLCGGSGLYIESVCKGLNKIPKIKEGIRTKLYNEMEIDGLEKLSEKLKKIDYDSWKRIDIKNPRKVIRCLEVYFSTKKTMSSFLQNKLKEKKFDTLYFFLNEKRNLLYEKINTRVEKMIKVGLQDEVKKILELNKEIALDTIGYKEFDNFFNNEQTITETKDLIKRNTRRYAKRQITWFKSKKFIEINPNEISKIETLIKEKRETKASLYNNKNN